MQDSSCLPERLAFRYPWMVFARAMFLARLSTSHCAAVLHTKAVLFLTPAQTYMRIHKDKRLMIHFDARLLDALGAMP